MILNPKIHSRRWILRAIGSNPALALSLATPPRYADQPDASPISLTLRRRMSPSRTRGRKAPQGADAAADANLGTDGDGLGVMAGHGGAVVRESPRRAPVQAAAIARRILLESLPALLAVGTMLGLIFGGCCSNVGLHATA